jgi:ribosome-binding factor A
MSQRTERIADVLRAELAELLLREVRDPRVRLATVSRIEVAADLGHALVHVSVLGDEDQRRAAVAGLESAGGFLRRELARRLSLRQVPALRFALDRGAEHSLRIEELLAGTEGEPGRGS